MNDSRANDVLIQMQAALAKITAEQAARASQVHNQFLDSQQEVLHQMGSLMQLLFDTRLPQTGSAPHAPVLFDRSMLEEFASGSVERCFGSEYAVFRGRRVPRIPNGILLLMDRVLKINGTPRRPDQLGEIWTEFDVPADAWFYQDQDARVPPYSVLMEMALQPCGFLSAYLGTMLLTPQSDLYFRNLDGDARILHKVDLRGQVVSAWAELIGHTLNEETVIQKFKFRLSVNGVIFFEGQSVFGFFPGDTMARQVGLDGGKESLPAFLQPDFLRLNGKMYDLSAGPLQGPTDLKCSTGRLALLDEVFVDPTGGPDGIGYCFASREIRAEDWYFTNHFFEDPVMPGSLGVEAILEAMRVYALSTGLGAGINGAHFDLVSPLEFNWKYRGQILSSVKQMLLEVKIRRVEEQGGELRIIADASLWADRIRIYEVKQAGIVISKG